MLNYVLLAKQSSAWLSHSTEKLKQKDCEFEASLDYIVKILS